MTNIQVIPITHRQRLLDNRAGGEAQMSAFGMRVLALGACFVF
jgi:hypothetical protein